MKGIYAYVDTMDNSVVYVGKDSHIGENRRHKQHFQQSNYDRQPINRVLQNNPNRYEYKKVFVFDDIIDTELNQLEMQQIALFNPKFNFTKGGEGCKGFKHSEMARKKISNFRKGTHLSEDTRKKISDAMKGQNNPCYGRTGKLHPSYGTKLSDEHKDKIRKANKGKKFSEEHKRRLRESISKRKNTTGYFRVIKCKNNALNQGFTWRYQYYEGNKQKNISSVNLDKLEEKVKAKGLEWYKFEEVE